MEIILSRTLQQLRIFPAIDILKSGTRREELLISKKNLEKICKLIEELAKEDEIEVMKKLKKLIAEYKSNDEMLKKIYK